MSVTVDYLVVSSNSSDLTSILPKLLGDTIANIYDEVGIYDEPPDEEELQRYITIRYTKKQEGGRCICGFSVNFNIESEQFNIGEERREALIAKFSQAVRDCEGTGIKHLLKLKDLQLKHTLRAYGEEIFEIEMKLREALSLIFVDTYGENFYDLLRKVNVSSSNQPNADHMRKYHQNQFFFLGFNSYVQINEPKVPNQPREIFQYIGNAIDFEDLRRMISSGPITKKPYADFLASLKERVVPIEKLRNCVAHNRSIPDEIIKDYNMAKEPLLESINEFLEQQTIDETTTGD